MPDQLPELTLPDANAWRAWLDDNEFVAMLVRGDTLHPQKRPLHD